MRMAAGNSPAYNVQTAVDAEHGMIVAQQVTTEATDNRSLLPMAEAAKQALDAPDTLNVVADAGYSNGEQAARQPRHQQPGRRKPVRPNAVYLRREDGHFPLSGKSDAHAQTGAEAQKDGTVCGLSRSLRPMPAEAAMYYGRTPLLETTPA